jgi:hypothetical protein
MKKLLFIFSLIMLLTSPAFAVWDDEPGGTDTSGCSFKDLKPSSCWFDSTTTENTGVLVTSMCQEFSVLFNDDITSETISGNTADPRIQFQAAYTAVTSKIALGKTLTGDPSGNFMASRGLDGNWLSVNLTCETNTCRVQVICFPWQA